MTMLPSAQPAVPLGASRRATEIPRVGSRAVDAVIEEMQAAGREVLPLSAYPRRPLPESVVEAARRAITRGAHAPAAGLPELRSAVAERLSEEFGARVSERQVIITSGGMDAVSVALATLLDPGDEVLLFSPCYFFEGLIRLAGGVPSYVPLDEATGYAFDAGRLEASVTPRSRVILLTNPNNPTGYVPTPAELREIAAVAERCGLFVVADESYDRLVYDGRRHHSIFAVEATRDRVLIARSFTKSFALSDWRVGYLLCPPSLVEPCVKVLEWRVLYHNFMSQTVAAATLAAGDGWLAGVAPGFQRGRDRMRGSLMAAGLTAVRPAGGPFLFVNIAHLSETCERFCERLLHDYGVPTTPGKWHGEPGHFRVAFGGEEAALDEAVRRIVQATKDL